MQLAHICRDAKYGVPSIYAAAMPGVWFGTGWAQAEDRLVQIDLVRRNAPRLVGRAVRVDRLVDDRPGQGDPHPLLHRRGVAGGVRHVAAMDPCCGRRLPRGSECLRDVCVLDAGLAGSARPVPVLGDRPVPRRRRVRAAAVHPARCHRQRQLPRGEFGGGGGDELSNLSFLQFLQGRYGAQQGYALFNDARWINDPTAPVTVPDRRPKYGFGGGQGNPVPPASALLTVSAASARHDPPAAVVDAAARALRVASSCSSRSARAITCRGRTARTRGS